MSDDFKRFQGVVHDSIDLVGDGSGDITVIAGDHADDSVSLRAWSSGHFDVGVRLSADQALALGCLLVAAAEDTRSRHTVPVDAGTDESEAAP